MPGHEGKALRKLLAALAHSHTEPAFDGAELENLGPLAISALDSLVEAMLSGALPDKELRDTLRPYLVRLVN